MCVSLLHNRRDNTLNWKSSIFELNFFARNADWIAISYIYIYEAISGWLATATATRD